MKKRLLCVFAHPDDECYGPGGTIAKAALAGVEVFITTFTAGEAGTIGVSKTLAPAELARRRRAELAAACDALGVAGHRILDVPDKGVAVVDPTRAVSEIVSDIRRLQPQVVLTFHHRGVSGHPDHVAVAGFLERSFDATAGTGGPVIYYEWGIPRHRVLLYQRPNLVPIEESEVAAVVDVSGEAMERKLAAIRAHETQYEFFLGLQAKFNYRELATPEHFTLRRRRGDGPRAVVADLWEGIDA
jgi:LmbE family N-acetylglucosaminyl deacetylase